MNLLTQKVKLWSDNTKLEFTKKLGETSPGESFECDGVLCTANGEKEFSALDLESGHQAGIKVTEDAVNFCEMSETKSYSDDDKIAAGDSVSFVVMDKPCTGKVTIVDDQKVTIDIDEDCSVDLFNVTLPIEKVSKKSTSTPSTETTKEFTFEEKVEEVKTEDPKAEETKVETTEETKTYCTNGDKCYVNTADGYVECTVKDSAIDSEGTIEVTMADGSDKRLAMDAVKFTNPMKEEGKTFSDIDGSGVTDATEVIPTIAVGDTASTSIFDRTVSGVIASISDDHATIELNDGVADDLKSVRVPLTKVAKVFSDDKVAKVFSDDKVVATFVGISKNPITGNSTVRTNEVTDSDLKDTGNSSKHKVEDLITPNYSKVKIFRGKSKDDKEVIEYHEKLKKESGFKSFSDNEDKKTEVKSDVVETKVETTEDPKTDEVKESELDPTFIDKNLSAPELDVDKDKSKEELPAVDPNDTIEGSKVFSYQATKSSNFSTIDNLLERKN